MSGKLGVMEIDFANIESVVLISHTHKRTFRLPKIYLPRSPLRYNQLSPVYPYTIKNAFRLKYFLILKQ